jgi:MurNAc alpha-1-phosphate uridylyltransferase
MKAMILAAGLGTRLGAITEHTPKCLVPVKGKPLLAHTIEHIKALGISSIVINTHHHAAQVEAYLKEHNNFGVEIQLSFEPELLETGGGLLRARPFFESEDEIIVHNADIYHSLDLMKFIEIHRSRDAVATLLVMQRESSRCLLFDQQMNLVGRAIAGKPDEIMSNNPVMYTFAFSGIQIVTQAFFDYCTRLPARFSIIEGYFEAARAGKSVSGAVINGLWSDVGTPERLALLDGQPPKLQSKI